MAPVDRVCPKWAVCFNLNWIWCYEVLLAYFGRQGDYVNASKALSSLSAASIGQQASSSHKWPAKHEEGQFLF